MQKYFLYCASKREKKSLFYPETKHCKPTEKIMNENNFLKETVSFLSKLAKNNNREWFEANKEEYEVKALIPAQHLVMELGDELQKLLPNVVANPKVDKSIFRIHRDVRFSKDKAPYKTHLAILLWEGSRKKMECSGFYFHVEPKLIFLGCGFYFFPPELQNIYRTKLNDDANAKQLFQIVSDLKKKKYQIGGKFYKKIPKGMDADSPFSELFLHNGLYGFIELKDVKSFYTKDIVKEIMKHFKNFIPLHKWLVKNI